MSDQKKRVLAAAQRPENLCCADCHCKLPASSIWASSTLGIFICINCSGRHRNLGTHITFVRSVNMDKWTDEQATIMESIGNEISNCYWEKNLPSDYQRPDTEDLDGLTKFVRFKYELAKWADKAAKPPNVLLKEGQKPKKKSPPSPQLQQQQQQNVQSVVKSSSDGIEATGAYAHQRSASHGNTDLFGNSSGDLSSNASSFDKLDLFQPQQVLTAPPIGISPPQQQQQQQQQQFAFSAVPSPTPAQHRNAFGISIPAKPSPSNPFGDSFASPTPQQQTDPFNRFNSPTQKQQPAFGIPVPHQPQAGAFAQQQPVFGFAPSPQQNAFGFSQPQQQPVFGFPAPKQAPPVNDPRASLKNLLSTESHLAPAPAGTNIFRAAQPGPNTRAFH